MNFITTEEIFSLFQINQNNLIFIDCSFKRLDSSLNSYNEYLSCHIKNSIYFNIFNFSLKNSICPPMIIDIDSYNESCSSLGISNDDHLILYGVHNSPSISRAWWTFKTFQHKQVSFLVGGIEAWKSLGGEVESGEPHERPRTNYISPGINRNLLTTREDILEDLVNLNNSNNNNQNKVIVDVRGASVYQSGHIPGSINIPINNFIVSGDYTRFKSPEEINHLLLSHNIQPETRVIFSCNSGMMASIATLARVNLNESITGEDDKNTSMYDGSWSEWILSPETNPIEISSS